MSHQKNRTRIFAAIAVVAACLCACASKKNIKSDITGLDMGKEEAILASSLNDLEQGAVDKNALTATSVDPTAAAETTRAEGAPFYQALGGESLKRVAYTLYGSRDFASKLEEMNPELKSVKILSKDQKVFFDFSYLNPQPMFLTKGLIENYTKELAASINASPAERGTETLKKGDTLQRLSRRLYGNERYWAEIYLINHDKLSAGYDHVPVGIELTVLRHPLVLTKTAGVSSKPEVQAPAIVEPVAPAPAAAAVIAPPAPPPVAAVEPSNNSAFPQMANQMPKQEPVKEIPKIESEPQVAKEEERNSTNLRRGVYLASIIALGSLAYYLTRPGKKSGFDMLDMTTQDTSVNSLARHRMNKTPDSDKYAG